MKTFEALAGRFQGSSQPRRAMVRQKKEGPTTYPEINRVLEALLEGLGSVLQDRLIGLYLYGSLASGDFNPETGDVDFVVVTKHRPTRPEIDALEALHTGLAAGGLAWARKLEGTYLPPEALRRQEVGPADYPCINEGKFTLAPLGADWTIQRHILRERGVVVAGPPPGPMIDPVGPEDLKQAVRLVLREWWDPIAREPSLLRRSDYQAYAVLSMCRALHTLKTGRILSKPRAAAWARSRLEKPWRPLIDRALSWKGQAGLDCREEVRAFIRHTLKMAGIPAAPDA